MSLLHHRGIRHRKLYAVTWRTTGEWNSLPAELFLNRYNLDLNKARLNLKQLKKKHYRSMHAPSLTSSSLSIMWDLRQMRTFFTKNKNKKKVICSCVSALNTAKVLCILCLPCVAHVPSKYIIHITCILFCFNAVWERVVVKATSGQLRDIILEKDKNKLHTQNIYLLKKIRKFFSLCKVNNQTSHLMDGQWSSSPINVPVILLALPIPQPGTQQRCLAVETDS